MNSQALISWNLLTICCINAPSWTFEKIYVETQSRMKKKGYPWVEIHTLTRGSSVRCGGGGVTTETKKERNETEEIQGIINMEWNKLRLEGKIHYRNAWKEKYRKIWMKEK